MTATRRDILKACFSGALVTAAAHPWMLLADDKGKPRSKLPVAAVVSVYTPDSHADVLVGKILEGYQQDGRKGPDLKIVSVFTDQIPKNDMSRQLAAQHGFRISDTIADALTLGSSELQVAGVLCIGEHGSYPRTPDTQQRAYPRRRFFDEVVSTFRDCRKTVPVFNDKHLGYRWEDAKAMVDTAHRMQFPFIAGSSVPVAWRMPPLDLPHGSDIEAALTIGYGGFEDYGFHAIEAHQCLLERRRGGESGVVAVQALRGDRIRESERSGNWSTELFAAARRQMPGNPEDTGTWKPDENSAVYLLEHRDGLRSAVMIANRLAGHFSTALRVRGTADPVGTWFQLQEERPFGHFAFLLRAIEETFHTGSTAWPIERTLLTTGILDRVMQSLAKDGQRIETPELQISYSPSDWPFANHPDSPLQLP